MMLMCFHDSEKLNKPKNVVKTTLFCIKSTRVQNHKTKTNIQDYLSQIQIPGFSLFASYFRSQCDLLQIKHQNNNCDHFATFITDSRQNSENHFKKTQTKAPYKSKNRHKSLFQGNSKVKVNILCETSKLQASKIYKASLCNSYKNQIQNCGIKLTEITVLI